MEPNFEKIALTPLPNTEDRLLAVRAQTPPFLTMSMAAASIFSFVTLVGLAIIKTTVPLLSAAKIVKPMDFQFLLQTNRTSAYINNCPHTVYVWKGKDDYLCKRFKTSNSMMIAYHPDLLKNIRQK
jgi:hypothetical protein